MVIARGINTSDYAEWLRIDVDPTWHKTSITWRIFIEDRNLNKSKQSSPRVG